jgi:ABC-2 type transport system permease protein
VSTIATNLASDRKSVAALRLSFFGIVRSEIFKVTRMGSIWISFVLMLGVICLPYLLTLQVESQSVLLKKQPLQFFYASIGLNLFVLRAFIGFFLLILTASVFGREYQLGTIRILLARGIGRLQLLFAKLLAVVGIALFVLLISLALNVLLSALQMTVLAGKFDGIKALNANFWHDVGVYILTVLISMCVTILLTVALTAVGRSFVFGLSASLAFFPADNIGTIFMRLGYSLTHNEFWHNATAYFLGPNLNAMPASIMPERFSNYSISPLVPVDGTHTLIIALVYAVIFVAAAIILTWKRDVKE